MSSLTSNLYQFGEFSLDPQSRGLRRGEATVSLTPKAFDLLFVLVQNAGRIVTKEELMKAVWADSFVEESNLTQTIFMVRKALEETSDRRYILTVQGQGYRFMVPVTEAVRDGLAETAKAEAEAEAAKMDAPLAAAMAGGALETQILVGTGRAKGWKAVGVAVAAVVLVAIAASAIWAWRSRPSAVEQPGRIMLAVLPFENFTGDEGQEYFSDGLTEEMISQLGNLDPTHLGIIARTSVMHYKHTQESIPEIGKDLGVQYVIEGSVRRDSERVRITAQLIQVKDQSHLWAREYDRDLSHLLELQAEIAREVANEIEFSLSGRRPIEAARQRDASATGAKSSGANLAANSYEAYDLYLKGRFFWNKRTGEGFRQAADYFQQAIDKDANYGRAYAGLADTFALMSTWYAGPQDELMPKARAAALRALELDESVAEAHASLALIKENYDYDWAGAEKEFRRAIQLDPQYASAHQWYAEFLSWQGRLPEAFAESEQARRLDPLSLIVGTDYASILYNARQYESAVKQCRAVLELDPSFAHARGVMIPSFVQLQRYDEAVDVIKHWQDPANGPWMWAWAAIIDSRVGRAEEARRGLAKLEQIAGSRADGTATLVLAYSGTGQKERALEWLERAYAQHSNAVVQIKVDPIYDPMRSDPRFVELLRRMKLER